MLQQPFKKKNRLWRSSVILAATRRPRQSSKAKELVAIGQLLHKHWWRRCKWCSSWLFAVNQPTPKRPLFITRNLASIHSYSSPFSPSRHTNPDVYNMASSEHHQSGRIMIFHLPRFHWKKGMSLTKPPFRVRSCEVAIIWPDQYTNKTGAFLPPFCPTEIVFQNNSTTLPDNFLGGIKRFEANWPCVQNGNLRPLSHNGLFTIHFPHSSSTWLAIATSINFTRPPAMHHAFTSLKGNSGLRNTRCFLDWGVSHLVTVTRDAPPPMKQKGVYQTLGWHDFFAESQTSSEARRPEHMTNFHETFSSWFPAKSRSQHGKPLKIHFP